MSTLLFSPPPLRHSSVLSFLIVLCLFFCPLSSSLEFPVNVWPKPTTFLWPHPQATFLSHNFTITFPQHRYHKHLFSAINRYRHLVLSEHHQPLVTPVIHPSPTSLPLYTLHITVSDLTAPLQHGVDESYNLTIPTTASMATLTAETAWGAMRGLETFSQLVWGYPSMVAVGLQIQDKPIFPHRGVLLDTSRNYYPVRDILRTIEALSANKLNVFHWHITDSQSFPLLLPSEPNLADKGSYGPEMQYSPEDVKKIVNFGLEHGVRVLPEIDTPGHTGSWAGAYPEIVACANMFWWPAGVKWADRFASEPGCGQLNPLNPKTFQVVGNVIKDVLSLFPEQFYHAGSDEVIPGCWKTDPAIRSFLSNDGNLSQLLEKFVNSTLPFIVSRNRTAVYWEDVLLDDNIRVAPSVLPPERAIMQTWNGGPDNTKRLVSAGYRTIVSSSDYYYLDCGHGGFVGNDSQYDQPQGTSHGKGGSWCAPFKTWQTIYDYDITFGLNEKESELVLGGEVALWSEQADATVLDGRLWPRAAAMGEALWSGNRDNKGKKRYAEATDRLNEWRHRMVQRGVNAEPIQPLWCARNTGMCNTVNSSYS
ncbi:Beta-hexosaminidase 2 [Ancistrocladus abbreviatus]